MATLATQAGKQCVARQNSTPTTQSWMAAAVTLTTPLEHRLRGATNTKRQYQPATLLLPLFLPLACMA